MIIFFFSFILTKTYEYVIVTTITIIGIILSTILVLDRTRQPQINAERAMSLIIVVLELKTLLLLQITSLHSTIDSLICHQSFHTYIIYSHIGAMSRLKQLYFARYIMFFL